MAAPASDVDSSLIRRAIGLAVNGRGGVEPNPMVGCVIVKDRQVIGEGYHQQYGGPHAEPNALASCTESPQGASVGVGLMLIYSFFNSPTAPATTDATVDSSTSNPSA